MAGEHLSEKNFFDADYNFIPVTFFTAPIEKDPFIKTCIHVYALLVPLKLIADAQNAISVLPTINKLHPTHFQIDDSSCVSISPQYQKAIKYHCNRTSFHIDEKLRSSKNPFDKISRELSVAALRSLSQNCQRFGGDCETGKQIKQNITTLATLLQEYLHGDLPSHIETEVTKHFKIT